MDWVSSRRLERDFMVPMRIGLTQNNLHSLGDMLMAVSQPDSPDYGNHWTATDLVKTFAPSTETIDEVSKWLVESGIARDRLHLSLDQGWIQVNATAVEVEELLKTEYYVFTHPSGQEQISCSDYSVPDHVQSHIDLIIPTVHFSSRPTTMAHRKRYGGVGSPDVKNGPFRSDQAITLEKSDLQNCDKYITLDCLRVLYGIKYKPRATRRNSFGIVEFTPQSYIPSDLDLFFKNFVPNLVGSRPKLESIDGGMLQFNMTGFDYNGESNLDLEYAMGLVNPQKVTLLQTGDEIVGASFNTWLDAVDGTYCTHKGGDDPNFDPVYPHGPPGYTGPKACGIIKPPHVISISYGYNEVDLTRKYAQRQCNEYGKLGLMGSSVFYSSGDNGVAGNGNQCVNPSTGQLDPKGTVFTPSFPGGCPWVTSVGATQINPGSSVYAPESACEQVIFSGGGFSNYFSIPDYQCEQVDHYLKKHTSQYTSAQFNNSGSARAFPDVAANGANYVVAINGEFYLVYGTSASSPVFASMISMINDARIHMGRKPVGFINPMIYSHKFKSAFNDITTGNNPGCGTQGFSATKGWDPVTGLGTPRFQQLLEMFKRLP